MNEKNLTEPKIKPQYKSVAIYFCGEAKGNAEKSVVMAGYSKAYARGNAHKIVARDDVQAYIKYLNSLTSNSLQRHIASIEEIQGFWTEIFTDKQQRTSDRLKASELLAKCKGMFNTDSW